MYVAVCSGPEDMIKVGLSLDPIARWSAFHARWYEAFDLEHSLLIETETRRDAQLLETGLHRALIDHNCPPPLTIRGQFGGRTEWYRGAYKSALEFVQSAASQGYVIHSPARPWFVKAMQTRADCFVSIIDHGIRSVINGELNVTQKRALRDLIDAHVAFDEHIVDRLPSDLSHL